MPRSVSRDYVHGFVQRLANRCVPLGDLAALDFAVAPRFRCFKYRLSDFVDFLWGRNGSSLKRGSVRFFEFFAVAVNQGLSSKFGLFV